MCSSDLNPKWMLWGEISTKKRTGVWGGRGNKIDVKQKRLWLHFEIKQINKSTKSKKRQMQQRCSYLYL